MSDHSGWYCPKHKVRFIGSAEKDGALPCGCPAEIYTFMRRYSGGSRGRPSVHVRVEVAAAGHLWSVFTASARSDDGLMAILDERFRQHWDGRNELLHEAVEYAGGTGMDAYGWESYGRRQSEEAIRRRDE
jgi:hypothetical protein